jgi:hypothetical protein
MRNFKFLEYDKEFPDWVWGLPHNYSSDEYRIEDEYYSSFRDFLSTFNLATVVHVLRVTIMVEEETVDITEDNIFEYLEEFTNDNDVVKVKWMNFDII